MNTIKIRQAKKKHQIISKVKNLSTFRHDKTWLSQNKMILHICIYTHINDLLASTQYINIKENLAGVIKTNTYSKEKTN